MPRIKVKDIIDSVYKKAGNLTRNQLPLEIVLNHLYDELDRRRVEMRLTEHNQLLKSADRPVIDIREQNVSIDDFGDPVAVHFIDPSNNVHSESPVEMVNFNTLPMYEADGQLKVALYGEPLKIRFSIALQNNLGWTLRFWYEPDERTRGINTDVLISPLFVNLISSVVALDSLPHAEMDDAYRNRIENRLISKIGTVEIEGTLENLWYKEISSSKQYGGNMRRPFRAGQPTNVRRRL